jgi:hypothetical protein
VLRTMIHGKQHEDDDPAEHGKDRREQLEEEHPSF